MSFLDIFRSKPKQTANLAKERLQIVVSRERAERNAPDYLPHLQRDLLEVIRRYVSVDNDHVKVNVERDGKHERLELSVSLPDGGVELTRR